MIDSQTIKTLIPHGEQMSLIDAVEFWDDARIQCTTKSHQSPLNPLLDNGQLKSVLLIEYAAQAMAIHGALLHRSLASEQKTAKQQKLQVIGSVKNLNIHVDTFQSYTQIINIEATRLMTNETGAIYTFTASAGTTPIIDAKLILISTEKSIIF